MTSQFRTITSGVLEWRGIVISVTLEKQRFVDHLQIETLEPARAPLPINRAGGCRQAIRAVLSGEAGRNAPGFAKALRGLTSAQK